MKKYISEKQFGKILKKSQKNLKKDDLFFEKYKREKKSKFIETKKNINDKKLVQKFKQNEKSANFNEEDYIIGVNSVLEALKSERTINKIMIVKARTSKQIKEIVRIAKEKKVVVQEVDHKKIADIANNQVHQGVIAYVSKYEYYDFSDMIKELKNKEKSIVLILDHITDTHNFGSILRTVDATNVDYVIIPNRRSVAINSVVSKTSAGAVEYAKVVKVSSLSEAIKELKKIGYWVYALDMDSDILYDKCDYSEKTVLVVGSEESGISMQVTKNCDEIVKIPMTGRINSLNVSVATALALYQVKGKVFGN